MKEIKTNAFFMDEDKNLCLMFGNHYIGIEAGEVKEDMLWEFITIYQRKPSLSNS